MKSILATLRRLSEALWDRAVEVYRRVSAWLAVPVNLCLAVLGLVFLVSFSTWAIADRSSDVVLWFPDAKGKLHSELRPVPVKWRIESRAELVASEVLLGPKTLSLRPDFQSGIRVETVMYRRGRLFVDISKEAALLDSKSLKTGLLAMERSLRAAIPTVGRLTVTIGGIEPYAVGLKNDAGGGSKKAGK